MLFQKKMRLPIDNEVLPLFDEDVQSDSEDNVTEVIEKLLESRMECFQTASCNITEAQRKQKESYDRKHQPAVFTIGSKVLLENTAQKQRKGGKMDPVWLGPYIISRDLGKGLYELSNMSNKIIKNKANVSRLKNYFERSLSEGETAPPPSKKYKVTH